MKCCMTKLMEQEKGSSGEDLAGMCRGYEEDALLRSKWGRKIGETTGQPRFTWKVAV